MADFDDRFGAATEGQDGPFDERFKRAATMPQSDPIPGLVHGAIPGIRGVVANGAPDQEDKPTPGIWSPGGPGPAKALGAWMRGRTIADDPFNVFPAGLPDKNVQHDNRLSEKPSRTDEPIAKPMNGGLPSQFGPGSMMGMPPLAGGGPTVPWPGTQPPAQPVPAPQQPASRPAPQMAQPSMAPQSPYQAPAAPSGPSPGVPAQDKSIIPQDSLLGRIMSGVNTWRDQNRLTLMAMAGGLAGSQSLGQGLGRAFTAAVPAMQADQAQQNQSATAQLLMQKMPGLSPEQALAMSRNPDIMKQIIPNLFGAKQKKWTKIGQDQFGNEKYGFVDEVSGKVYDEHGNAIAGGGGGTAETTGGVSGDSRLQGEDYLKTMPNQGMANTVRAIGEGREQFPPQGRNNPYTRQLQAEVNHAYPEVNAQTYGQVQKAMNYWYSGGKGDQTMKALDQALNHAGELAAEIDRAPRAIGDMPTGNALWNWARGQAGYTTNNPMGTMAHAVADELSTLWKGQATDHEIQAWKQAFPVNGSKEQQRDAFRSLSHLVEGGVQALRDQRTRDFGNNKIAERIERERQPESPQAEVKLEKLRNWAEGKAGTRAGDAAAVPPVEKRETNKVYQTPQGPMIWRGSGWEPAK